MKIEKNSILIKKSIDIFYNPVMKSERHIPLANLHLLKPKSDSILFFFRRFAKFVGFFLLTRTAPQYFLSLFFWPVPLEKSPASQSKYGSRAKRGSVQTSVTEEHEIRGVKLVGYSSYIQYIERRIKNENVIINILSLVNTNINIDNEFGCQQ